MRTPAAFGYSGGLPSTKPAEDGVYRLPHTTPALSDERFNIVISDKWLLGPGLSDKAKTGLVCRIQDTFTRGDEQGWMDGIHEGELAGVLTVFDAYNERYTSRARIRLIEKPGTTQVLEIPVNYLRPVHPENAGEDVVVLSGEHKGYDAKVKEVNDTSATVLLTGTQLIVEVSPKQLCRRLLSIAES